ncbi:MAG: fluoride efflux transporter CrcB [Chitinophagaceae bacterium]|nr:fluoride efflux transporter CrcB [Bacteroidota bacterium]MCC6256702.1 fluoride efflux transporter CrcB [Chitinophagaceae bacterium]MCW5918065.1 fluoride efflux transporter CrcB [Ferruginibacter sp.]
MKAMGIIWLGGGLGSVLRYLSQVWVSRILGISFPFGTFLVNILGCFLIGLFFAVAEKYAFFTSEWRLFLITGLCGGFTTFSSFSYEGLSLYKQGDYGYFFLYLILSVVIGLLATMLGFTLVK